MYYAKRLQFNTSSFSGVGNFVLHWVSLKESFGKVASGSCDDYSVHSLQIVSFVFFRFKKYLNQIIKKVFPARNCTRRTARSVTIPGGTPVLAWGGGGTPVLARVGTPVLARGHTPVLDGGCPSPGGGYPVLMGAPKSWLGTSPQDLWKDWGTPRSDMGPETGYPRKGVWGRELIKQKIDQRTKTWIFQPVFGILNTPYSIFPLTNNITYWKWETTIPQHQSSYTKYRSNDVSA